MEVDKAKGKEDDMGEDEDEDNEYGYNYWDDFVRNDCVTYEDDNFEGSPAKGGSGGQSGLNGNRRSGAGGGRGQESGNPGSGRGQGKSATGGSKRMKNSCKRSSEENTDEVRDYISTSRTVGVHTPKKQILAKVLMLFLQLQQNQKTNSTV